MNDKQRCDAIDALKALTTALSAGFDPSGKPWDALTKALEQVFPFSKADNG